MNEINELFKKYQKPLIVFANTTDGRDFLSIPKDGLVVSISPSSVVRRMYLTGSNSHPVAVKHLIAWAGNHFAEKLLPTLLKLEVLTESEFRVNKLKALNHYSGIDYDKRIPQIFLTTTTFNVSSTSNGVRNVNTSTWSQARGGTGGTVATNNFVVDSSIGGNFQCGRYFGFFNTSVIGGTGNISAGHFIVPQASNKTNDDGGNVIVNVHTATDPVGAGAFGNITLDSDVSQGSTTMASISTTGTTSISLNTTGLSSIQKNGTTKFGLRSSLDVNNTQPGGVNQFIVTVTSPQIDATYTQAQGGVL